MTKYQNDPDFKLRVKKLAALAFLPLADVIDAFVWRSIVGGSIVGGSIVAHPYRTILTKILNPYVGHETLFF